MQKQKDQKDKKNGQLICMIIMASLGFICKYLSNTASPKLISVFTDKSRFPQNFSIPTLFQFIAFVAAYLFCLVTLTVCLRIFTGKSLPAQYKDSNSIQSINNLIKNTLITSFCFLALYIYASKKWKGQPFKIEILPSIFLGTLILELGFRILQLILDVKGIRYLAQSINFFIISLLAFQVII